MPMFEIKICTHEHENSHEITSYATLEIITTEHYLSGAIAFESFQLVLNCAFNFFAVFPECKFTNLHNFVVSCK